MCGFFFFNKEKRAWFCYLEVPYRCKRQLLLLTPWWLHSGFSFPVYTATEDCKAVPTRRGCWNQSECKAELNPCKTVSETQGPFNLETKLLCEEENDPSLVSESLRLEWRPARRAAQGSSGWVSSISKNRELITPLGICAGVWPPSWYKMLLLVEGKAHVLCSQGKPPAPLPIPSAPRPMWLNSDVLRGDVLCGGWLRAGMWPPDSWHVYLAAPGCSKT